MDYFVELCLKDGSMFERVGPMAADDAESRARQWSASAGYSARVLSQTDLDRGAATEPHTEPRVAPAPKQVNDGSDLGRALVGFGMAIVTLIPWWLAAALVHGAFFSGTLPFVVVSGLVVCLTVAFAALPFEKGAWLFAGSWIVGILVIIVGSTLDL